ncbi:hypothetical protein ACL02T_28290 [Pseudonocardia sp. RS010]|uniref:hypothetical protein n=1 Tax=Pseudonocardia sp. RS010 TaxID=3385979 RepID=UPI0039A39717
MHLDFRATVPLPLGARQLAELVLARRVRRLHVKDLRQLKKGLRQLKAHVEKTPAL